MGRQRRSPALGGRIFVAASSVAATIAMVGWMGRVSTAGSDPQGAPVEIIRRIVVVETKPASEPYIALKAAPAGQEVVVVTRPARVIHRPAPAATPGPVTAAPVAKSSGS